ncbi:hypothetical protein KFE25_005348 [Diacronema lutheri]|uniref:Uncharacterized protein n=2 Tax=Diacronema lutheri TaxID=2081491 RepID=A0A8J5XJG4_DIALT|nr:hypothetical protein KFE25_005348 [Diacronema lutheri]
MEGTPNSSDARLALQRRREALLAAGMRTGASARSVSMTPPDKGQSDRPPRPPRALVGALGAHGADIEQWAVGCAPTASRTEAYGRARGGPGGQPARAAHDAARAGVDARHEAAERWAVSSGIALSPASAAAIDSPASEARGTRTSALEVAREAAIVWASLSNTHASAPGGMSASPATRTRARGADSPADDDAISIASSAPREMLVRAGEWRWTVGSTNTSPGSASTPVTLAAAGAWGSSGGGPNGFSRRSSAEREADEAPDDVHGAFERDERETSGSGAAPFERRPTSARADVAGARAAAGVATPRLAAGAVSAQPDALTVALFKAAKRGDTARVAALLGSVHERALALAPRAGSAQPAEMLCAMLDTPWVGSGSSHGWCLLHVAAEQGHVPIARLLLERGACPRVVHAPSGFAPIHFAAREGRSTLASLLLERRADGAASERHGWTALHLACQAGDEAVAALLLRHAPHALHNRTAKRTESALHVAARSGRIGCASLLLQADADPTALNRLGRTPLDLAQAAGHEQLVRLLEQWLPPGKHGADAAARSTHPFAQKKNARARGESDGGGAPPRPPPGLVLSVPPTSTTVKSVRGNETPAAHSGAADTPAPAAAAADAIVPARQAHAKAARQPLGLWAACLRGAASAVGFAATLSLIALLLAIMAVDVECDGNSSVCSPT